jgi:hypothetical protein
LKQTAEFGGAIFPVGGLFSTWWSGVLFFAWTARYIIDLAQWIVRQLHDGSHPAWGFERSNTIDLGAREALSIQFESFESLARQILIGRFWRCCEKRMRVEHCRIFARAMQTRCAHRPFIVAN